jgi:hypothetical protein
VRLGVAGLVDPEPAAAWETDEGQATPILVAERPLDGDSFAFDLSHCDVEVFAHQINLLPGLLGPGRMHRHLRGRKRKDEPATSRIHEAKVEHIFEEGPICVGVAAVDDGVSPIDHFGNLLKAGEDVG